MIVRKGTFSNVFNKNDVLDHNESTSVSGKKTDFSLENLEKPNLWIVLF